jgi:hypothetical protein
VIPGRLRQLNWRYAFTEVTLIFIGITLALVFNNWNDGRKNRMTEAELLEDLYSDLSETLADLENDIGELRNILGAQREVLKIVQEKREFDPAMDDILESAFYGAPVLFEKNSAYEALKNLGLGIIVNREIRTRITDLYELTFARIDDFETITDEYQRDVLESYYREHFEIADTTTLHWEEKEHGQYPTYGYAQPSDWSSFLDDSKLPIIMIDSYNLRYNLLDRYLEAEAEIREIEVLIAASIG